LNSEVDSHSPLLPEGEVLRPNDWSQPAAWMLALFAVGAGLLLLLTEPARGSSLTGSLRPVLGLAWIAFGLISISKVRAGVLVQKDGIEVRSRLHASSYQWSAIKQFTLQPSMTRNNLQIELKDGKLIRAHGFGVRSSSERCRAESMVAELNRRVAAR